MSYIKTEAEKKKGKVNLLITTGSRRHEQPHHPDPMENGNVIHFLFSRLLKEKGPIQSLNSIAVSLDLQNRHSYGIFRIGKHNAQPDYDVSNYVHGQAYVRIVRGAKTCEEVDAAWGSEDNTTFIPGLTHEAWHIAQTMLCGIRNERIRIRAENPRKTRGQSFKDDLVDVAIGQMISRVNAILNEILYWGDTENVTRFSPDTLVYS